ncbi:uncharacterized protein PHACADRAFT_257482 [Phanerochaete carnosa HHB-10118-sp]|uniref:Protein kinase domain-containing protein n=1 Tax=Phanerochaete carnosa (strain HHB-10118-sp) TaxID=650164 RepID=K5VR68_PHACS|nr:uncharacterized protein PHACADRAFT_257482 [Phanerochaete carnosa HHB-10118-sp]EKM53963.1 hypothetical protein PHACADRAFT_257482 [Phanerochaete carnosa HHB-10118-sp]
MLQYSVQLPPLSLSSSKPKARKAMPVSAPQPPSTDVSHDSNPAAVKRTGTARTRPSLSSGPAYGHSIPLAISTAFPPPPLTSSHAGGRSSSATPSPSVPSSSLSSPSLPPTPSLGSAFPFSQQVYSAPSPRLAPAQLSKVSTRSPLVQSTALPSAPVPMPGARPPRSPKAAPLPYSGLSSPALPSPKLPQSTFSATNSYYGRTASAASSTGSSFSSCAIDVLAPGDILGDGLELQGEMVRRVPIGESKEEEEPANVFRVVRKLGAGSYAVVYLVQEVLGMGDCEEDDRDCESDGADLDMSVDGHDRDVACVRKEVKSRKNGREYAVKLLSKANLDEEALSAQMLEATIHQSLPPHPNIVTLHRTLETPSYLLLLLEFVPGEDLFYFLEQARDHYDPSFPGSPAETLSPSTPISALPSTSLSGSDCSMSSESTARTPPTPSLLATMSPTKLLSRTRLKLIASMFKQMCDAVAACHERGIFHRDIKPENFIVTDGVLEVRTSGPGGKEEVRKERRVVVKLTDFGLSTTDMHSADMDCGSAPYMSYECRNNIHPNYMPRAADVWSLGIVLINMLYHYNPWTDTTDGVCPSFSLFQQSPVSFFTTRFTGMTQPVAEFLATKVFCILLDHRDDSPRASARDFGQWIQSLPDLLAPPLRPGSGHNHSRSPSFSVNLAEVPGHRLASIPHSRRPSLRSAAGSRTPSVLSPVHRASLVAAAISRQPSLQAFQESEHEHNGATKNVGVGLGMLPPLPDHEVEEDANEQEDQHEESNSRSASTQKRRKRGARKGKKDTAMTGQTTPAQSADDTLTTLASASQALAREISKTSKRVSGSGISSPLGTSTTHVSTEVQPQPVPAPSPAPTPTIVKKPSKWKLGFGKSSSSSGSSASTPANPKEEPDPKMSTTASKATSLIMGLNAPSSSSRSKADAHQAAASASSASIASHATSRYAPVSANTSVVSLDDPTWHRDRRYRGVTDVAGERDIGMWGASTQRGPSPASASQLSFVSASTASTNWRSSISSSGSAATSTSAFTRYSNGSVRSVSTAATSVSNTSWRSAGGASNASSRRDPRLPPNVKMVTGEPWELSELPRQMYPDPEKVQFSAPPTRKRAQKPKNSNLDTISERPGPYSTPQLPQHPPATQPPVRTDASTSTTDLSHTAGSGDADTQESHGSASSPRKVQKGQINALAKMLSALRR